MTRGGEEHPPPAGPSRRAATGAAGGRGEIRFAVILGATSPVGRYLAERLAGLGFEGWCLTRGPEPAPYEVPAGFSWRIVAEEGSVSAPPSAALFSVVPISALPALLTRISGGERLIALSTASVVFKAESSDPDERRLARALKRAEEDARRVCRDRRIAWTILRPTLIYDPGRDRNVSAIAAFIRRFGVFPIVWPGLGCRQPIHAGDVARAMAAVLDAPGARGTLIDLPGGQTLTYRDMVRAIFASLGRRPVLVYLPLGPARVAFRVWRAATGAKYSAASLERMNVSLTLDPAPAREILGFTGRPFRPRFPDPRGR